MPTPLLIGRFRNPPGHEYRTGFWQGAALLRLHCHKQATEELRNAVTQLRELQQRLRRSSDSLKRQTVRAPVDGAVMSLRVNGAGAVVAPRAPLLKYLMKPLGLFVQRALPEP